jgi:hypothetical protein
MMVTANAASPTGLLLYLFLSLLNISVEFFPAFAPDSSQYPVYDTLVCLLWTTPQFFHYFNVENQLTTVSTAHTITQKIIITIGSSINILTTSAIPAIKKARTKRPTITNAMIVKKLILMPGP